MRDKVLNTVKGMADKAYTSIGTVIKMNELMVGTADELVKQQLQALEGAIEANTMRVKTIADSTEDLKTFVDGQIMRIPNASGRAIDNAKKTMAILTKARVSMMGMVEERIDMAKDQFEGLLDVAAGSQVKAVTSVTKKAA